MRISDIRNTQQFQDLCQQLFAAEYEDLEVPDDSSGDEGSDGYVPSKHRLFAIYCPEKYPPPDEYYRRKIRGDLSKAVSLRDEQGYVIDEWVFVTPAPLPMEVLRYLRDKVKEAGFTRGISWSEKHLLPLLLRHRELQPLYPELFAPDLQADVQSGFAALRVEMRSGFDSLLAESAKVDNLREKFESRVAQEYERRFQAAKSLFNEGQFRQAKATSEAILRDLQQDADASDPKLLARAATNIAVCAWQLDEMEEVVRWFEEAYHYTPDDPKVAANRATALMYRGETQEALASVERVLAAQPDDDNAIIVKANILLKEERYGEITAFLEEKGKRKLSTFFSSVQLGAERRYGEAAQLLRDLLREDPDDLTYLEHAAANILVEQQRAIERERRLPWRIGGDIRQALQEAEGYLTRAIELLRGREATHKLAGAYLNRSAARLMLGRAEESLDDCREILRLDPDNANAHLNASKAQMELGDYAGAAASLERYSELAGSMGDKARDLVYCYYASGDLEKAGEALQRELDREWTEADLTLVSLGVHIYDLGQNRERAADLVRRAEERFPDHSGTYTIRARHEQDTGGARVEEFLRRAVETADAARKEVATLDLADHLYSEERFDEALPLYEQVVSEHEFTPVNRRYLVCLYNSGRFADAIAYAERMRAGQEIEPDISQIEALAQKNLGHLRRAADIFLALYQREPAKTDYIVEYGICLFRLDEEDKALQAFDQARNRVSRTKDLLALAHGYSFLGRSVPAVKLGYQALQQSPNDPHVHRVYQNLVLNMKDGEGPELGEEYAKAFQESIATFNTRFPEEEGMKLINVEKDFSGLFEVLDQGAARTATILEQYRNGVFPVSTLATLKGRNLYDVWLGLQAIEGVRMSLGTLEEIERENHAVVESREVVIDPLALFTLTRARQLGLLRKMFDRLLVHQDAFDDIQAAIREERRGLERGKLSIGKFGGQYFKDEIPPEAVKKSVDFLEGVKTFVKDECEVVGFDRELSEEDWALVESVGQPAGSPAMLAAQRRVPLYSDDGLLRHLFNKERGVTGFSSFTLFTHAANKGLMSRSRFYDLTLLLLRMNYRFVPVSVDCLMHGARLSGFRGGGDFERALNTLVCKESDTTSMTMVIAGFLARLWLAPLPALLKTFVLRRLLRAATQHHPAGEVIGPVLDHARGLMQGVPDHYLDLLGELRRWADECYPGENLTPKR
jgi:tetratricopeptide (TPR) repeat protein